MYLTQCPLSFLVSRYLLCSSLRRLLINPQRPPQPVLRSHLFQPENPHWLPHSRSASSQPISAPCSDASVWPQPTAAPAAGGQGVSAERQASQRVSIWRPQHGKHRLACVPAQKGKEAEVGLCRSQRASACQAAQERTSKKHQRLAPRRPPLWKRRFLFGR